MRKQHIKRMLLRCYAKIKAKLSVPVQPKEKKLDILIESLAKELCNDSFEGEKLSSKEVQYVITNLPRAVKEHLLIRANKYSESAKQHFRIAEQENNHANEAMIAASYLTQLG